MLPLMVNESDDTPDQGDEVEFYCQACAAHRHLPWALDIYIGTCDLCHDVWVEVVENQGCLLSELELEKSPTRLLVAQ